MKTISPQIRSLAAALSSGAGGIGGIIAIGVATDLLAGKMNAATLQSPEVRAALPNGAKVWETWQK